MTEPGGEHSSVNRAGEDLDKTNGDEAKAKAPILAGKERRGLFGVTGSGDTSGFGGLRLPAHVAAPSERPYGGWFDEVADELFAAISD